MELALAVSVALWIWVSLLVLAAGSELPGPGNDTPLDGHALYKLGIVAALTLGAVGALFVAEAIIGKSSAAQSATPLLAPFVKASDPNFGPLLVGLAAIFVALAATEAGYVTRLDEMHPTVKVRAALFWVSAGFWAFSLGVPVVLTGLTVGKVDQQREILLALSQWLSVYLFGAGWLVLMAGALRTRT